MKITKKSVVSYIDEVGVKQLERNRLIECFLVLEATQVDSSLSEQVHQEIKRRNVCFSEFYNFAKFKWSKAYLVMLSKNSKENVQKFVSEFDDANSGYQTTSAPRQKGRIVARLYSMFYNRQCMTDMSIVDANDFYQLVLDKFDLFKGDRGEEDNSLTRNDLYGIVGFIRTLFEINNSKLPVEYLARLIPDDLIKSVSKEASRGKVKMNIEGSHFKYQEYSFLYKYHNDFLNSLVLKTRKTQDSAFRNLLDYIQDVLSIDTIKNVDEVKELLVEGRSSKSRFLYYLENTVKSAIKGKANYIRDLMLRIMNENHINPEHGFEPLFNNYEWDKIQRNKVYRRPSSVKDETPKAVIPMRVHQLALDILSDPEYKWAKSLEDQYFYSETGERVFNPTLNNLLALIFQLPIRVIQAQVLDSGEGDEYRYDFENLRWKGNDSEHCGYWKSLYASQSDRGFVKRDASLVREAVKAGLKDEYGELIVRQAYIYINTNKTQDRSVGFSDVSGYTIPWHHNKAFEIYRNQIEFITKYHPVKSPARMKDISKPQVILGSKPTKGMLDIIPDRFYLFRCNLNKNKENRDFPPSKQLITKMWNQLMLEIQRRLSEEGSDFSVISQDKMEKFKSYIGGGNTYISYLTPHCTRVTGITRLEEFGVPINIISKLIAGHANVRTTYRYTKHNKNYVNDRITEAQMEIDKKMELELTDDLKHSNIEMARRIAYVPDIYSTSWDDIRDRSWNSNGLGICPNSGTLCEEGHLEGEIEFSGVGRCLNCKYLISGKPFLVSIWSHVNSLLYKAKNMNDDYSVLQRDYKELVKSKKAEFKKNGRSDMWKIINKTIEKAENVMEMNSEDLNAILTEVFYGNLLFEKVRNLTNTEDDFVEDIGFEDCTNFEHLNAVVESESYLPYFMRDKDMKFKRDIFVDKALMAIGEQPIFLRNLTGEEKEQAIKSIANMIESDIKAREGKFLGAALKLENLTEVLDAA
ncbi:TPA: hypothetical protein RQK05_000896 [Vibrio vulnificus]|nr:hypothetical protein [Vibrio vulnificus]HDY7746310.1 hypothetical protein [Vibrio vulnificus]HDY7755905.1 hypothetical protein [Vibrio vulnificus]HDY7760322.1 hypothetical protein [Vibrio vulnificus]HDY7769445.1 hypothetical protein [Vibrio vulnificus]